MLASTLKASKSRSGSRKDRAAAALMKVKQTPYYQNDDIYLKESSLAGESMVRSPLRESELSFSRSPSTRIGHSPGGIPRMVHFSGLRKQRHPQYEMQRSD